MSFLEHSALYWFVLWCVMSACMLTMTFTYGRALALLRKQGKMIDELLEELAKRSGVVIPPGGSVTLRIPLTMKPPRIDN